MNNHPKVLMASILILACHRALAAALFVATDGNDANPGTAEKPFMTLERARDEIRGRKAGGPLPVGGITVEVRGGVYELARPIELTELDSGTDTAPIVYRARRGEVVKIVGGRTVAGWQLVTNPAVLKWLDPAAAGKVFQADLKALGITDLHGIGNAGVYQSDPGLELFFRDQPMTLARYPNSGYLGWQVGLDGIEGRALRNFQGQSPGYGSALPGRLDLSTAGGLTRFQVGLPAYSYGEDWPVPEPTPGLVAARTQRRGAA